MVTLSFISSEKIQCVGCEHQYLSSVYTMKTFLIVNVGGLEWHILCKSLAPPVKCDLGVNPEQYMS